MSLPNCYRCGCQPCECRDGITLYHADCREVLPKLEAGSVDLVLADPSYGVNYTGGHFHSGNVNIKREREGSWWGIERTSTRGRCRSCFGCVVAPAIFGFLIVGHCRFIGQLRRQEVWFMLC